MPNDILVVGRHAENSLSACLARACPPTEEVEASLQASVEQFTDGRYDDAQRTLQTAIRRNRDRAAEMPGPVASLYATLAAVAEHQGDNRLWEESARSNVQTLRSYLGESHNATLSQELAFADDLVRLEKPDVAATTYQKVQRDASEHGKPEMAARAAFRRAWLALLSNRDAEAERLADDAVAIAGTNSDTMLKLRDILHARIAIRHGDETTVSALAARLRQSANDTPQLLFAPSVDDINPARHGVTRNPWNDANVRYAVVGYWIRPDGRTAGAEVLRTSGLGQWSPGILRQVTQRRYPPLNMAPGQLGIYRIDRFTVRATKGTPTGSRIPQRMGDLSVHIIDLTETDAMTAAQRERQRAAVSNPG